MSGPYVAIITDDLYEEKTVLVADSLEEIAVEVGNYVSASGAPCCPPPPVEADWPGWRDWFMAFLDEDQACPVEITLYGPEWTATPLRQTLTERYYRPEQMREWTQLAGPKLALARSLDRAPDPVRL